VDFSWSDAQDALYGRVLEAAERLRAEATPHGGPDRERFRARWRCAAEAGLAGLSVPSRYGGGGHDALTTARAVEAWARGSEDMSLSFALSAHLFACCMPIAERGGGELRSRLLPGLCSGERIAANAITETDAGSDVNSLTTRARPDGDHYVLSGAKSWVTNAPVADVFVVYATSDPRAGFLGISAFVVERDRPGVRVEPPIDKAVLEGVPASALTLDECRVPAENLLGDVGQGAAVFQRSMIWERAVLFAGYLGMLDRQLERTVEHARTRRQFGRPIGKNQAVGHAVADMKVRLESARLLLYRAAWAIDQGCASEVDVAAAKLAVSEAAIASSLAAVQIHGSLGVTREAGVERMLRDALPSTIFSGTSEMQREMIARGLGL
jgi:alkylation response protein AidB-like acyl-CoA dehydrogenase